jgi:hypothetical protein
LRSFLNHLAFIPHIFLPLHNHQLGTRHWAPATPCFFCPSSSTTSQFNISQTGMANPELWQVFFIAQILEVPEFRRGTIFDVSASLNPLASPLIACACPFPCYCPCIHPSAICAKPQCRQITECHVCQSKPRDMLQSGHGHSPSQSNSKPYFLFVRARHRSDDADCLLRITRDLPTLRLGVRRSDPHVEGAGSNAVKWTDRISLDFES